MQPVPPLATVRLLAALTPCAEKTAERYLRGEPIKGHFLLSRLDEARKKVAKIETVIAGPNPDPAAQ